jgi:hypothetical protein
MEQIKISGFAVLFIGITLLLFTFISAYQLLVGVLDIPAMEDLMGMFGEALAPLIAYAIRALYLGIMGWVGSIMTRRGVQIVISLPNQETAAKPFRPKLPEEPKKV